MQPNLFNYIKLYNQLISEQAQGMETVDMMEGMIGDLTAIVRAGEFEVSHLVTDDTTDRAVQDMKAAAETILPHLTAIVDDYDIIANATICILVTEVSKLCTSVAILYYSTFEVSEVIDWISSDASRKFANAPTSKALLQLKEELSEPVEKFAEVVCSVFKHFKPYMPEYFLSEEELADIYAAIEEQNLPSNYIGDLTPEFVSKIIGGIENESR